MRCSLSIALASLLVAALAVPTAQAATRRYDFQDISTQAQMRIQVSVYYKNRQPHGKFTPRLAIYDSSVPVSCSPPVASSTAPSGSYILGSPDYNRIKLRKGSFTYSYSYEIPSSITGGAPGSTSATATGKVIKKKRKGKKLRVDGSVSILDYEYPVFGMHNCTSGGPVPYSATPCRYPNSPPYIKKSLPSCLPDV